MTKAFVKRDIAVIGAGVGGLSVAAALCQDGHNVWVFDQMKTPKPIGSGIVVQPTGRDVLESIGAWEYVRDHGHPISRIFGYECESGKTTIDVSYGNEYGLGINRGALFQGLWDTAMSCGVQMCSGLFVTDVNGRFVHHDKGREGPFDVIVDASGVNSKLSPLKAQPLPYGALWTCVDWVEDALPKDRLSQVYRKADKMLGILPIGRMPGESAPKAALFWSLPAGGYEVWKERGLSAWKEEAIGFWKEFAPFANQIQKPEQLTMARYTHGTLKNPVDGNLVYIGDAAHRTSPQLGQGANMALVDAQALRLALRGHHLADGLRAYVAARRYHTWVYQTFSKMFTPQYQSDSKALPWLRDNLLYPLSTLPPAPFILRQMVMGTVLPPMAGLCDETKV